MARTKLPATGVWRLVSRAQRAGFSKGMAGRGGPWLALGVGAWGLQRMRTLAARQDEVLLREPVAPGQSITITTLTTTRAEAKAQAKRDAKEAERARRQAEKEAKAARKAERALPRKERKALQRSRQQA